jgi:mannose-6-phosphate isomerase-like protein (cupin superfamily)
MRLLLTCLTLPLLSAALIAQQPSGQAVQSFASSADVTALIAKAKAERKEGQAIVIEKILQFAPYSANLEYRPSAGSAAVHEKEAEMMYVIDGSATLVTGGKLVGETRTNATNLSGSAIQGGDAKKVSKGDFLVVPEGTPHQFTAVDGAVVLMTIKMPRGGAVTP